MYVTDGFVNVLEGK